MSSLSKSAFLIALLLATPALAQTAPSMRAQPAAVAPTTLQEEAAPAKPPKQLTGAEKTSAELPLAWWQTIQQSIHAKLPGDQADPINNELDKQLLPQIKKLQFPE